MKAVLVAVFFLIALGLYGPGSFFVCWDLSTYLNVAKNVSDGQGFIQSTGSGMASHAGFPATLAVLLKLTGPSTLAIAWFLAVASATTATALLTVGIRLFGVLPGLAGGLLFLLVPESIFAMPRLLDGVWPGLLLGSLLLLLVGKRSHRWAEGMLGAVAGLLAAYSTGIKEISLLFFPLPLLLRWLGSIPATKTRLASFYGMGSVGLLGFFLLRRAVPKTDPEKLGTTLSENTGVLARAVGEETGLPALWELVQFGFVGVWRYFFPSVGGSGIFRDLPLVPLMLLALVPLSIRAIRGDRAARVPVLLFVAFLPLIGYCGQLQLRYGQIILVLAILALVLGNEIVFWTGKVLRRLPGLEERTTLQTGLSLLILACFLGAQIGLSARPMGKVWADSFAGRKLRGEETRVRHRGTDLSEWLINHGSLGDGLMIPRADIRDAVAWHTDDRYRLFDFPMRTTTDLAGNRHYPPTTGPLEDPLYLTAAFNSDHAERALFLTLSHGAFARSLEENQIRFIALLVNDWRNNIAPWLLEHPGIKHRATVRDDNTAFLVFEVQSPDLDASLGKSPALMHPNVSRYLAWTFENDPPRYRTLTEELLGPLLGLDSSQLEPLRQGVAPPNWRLLRLDRASVSRRRPGS